jgi:hypothetical protein
MIDLILTTFDWVPEKPRGYVRDIRVRWALEEAELPYRVKSTPFRARGAEHFAHQPFGQVPYWDGSVRTSSSRPGSSTWSRCWQDATGWPGPSPSPTYSWRMCCALSIGSTSWRDIPPVVIMSRAPRRAHPS